MRPASVTTVKDGTVSVVLRVTNDNAIDAFGLHFYMDKPLRVEFWTDD